MASTGTVTVDVKVTGLAATLRQVAALHRAHAELSTQQATMLEERAAELERGEHGQG